MELSETSVDANNLSTATDIPIDKKIPLPTENTSVEVPEFLTFNQSRSHQISDRLKQIEARVVNEVETLSIAQHDVIKIFEGFADELKQVIKEKMKELEEKMQNDFLLISELLEYLAKFEESLLNFVKNSFEIAVQPTEDFDDDEEEEEEKTSTSGVMSKSISKSQATESSKRKKIPAKAMTVLKQWLFENLQDPYPSNQVKEDLAKKTNLSFKQVHNWFINARGRIWKKMVNQERFGNMVEKCYAQNVNGNKK